MSLKWEKTKAWDRENLTGALTPVRLVLRFLSSVWLGVGLLVLIAMFGILASVPVGMLALIPTYLIYLLTVLLTVAVVAGIPGWWVHWTLRQRMPQMKAMRFVVVFVLGVSLAAVSVWGWYRFAWPVLAYDTVTHSGFRLFPEFVQRNQVITMRRLPAFEMSETEFYAWWPLKAMLGLFVINMTVATVRRIEFDFKHIGVLTVHSGIVTLALGSFMYGGSKIEGDTLLLAGPLGADGKPEEGLQQDAFYDYQRTALFLTQGDFWEQRMIEGLPRYNDYNIGVAGPPGSKAAIEAGGQTPPYAESVNAAKDGIGGGVLNIPVPAPISKDASGVQRSKIDSDLRFKVVGFASYANPTEDFIERPVDLSKVSPLPETLAPLRTVYLLGTIPDESGKPTPQRVFSFVTLPHDPVHRIRESQDLAIEYTRGLVKPSIQAKLQSGMSDQRWADLAEALPPKTRHALVIEVPGDFVNKSSRQVVAVTPGMKFKVSGSEYQVEVKDLAEQPPFPIITAGYKGATSSVAIVRITAPDGKSFERYVYHRFPEINQDMLDERNDKGMPKRRDADPAIRISYIDASKLQIYVDEVAGEKGDRTRVLIREPAGGVKVIDDIGARGIVDEIFKDPKIGLEIGVKWADSRKVDRPLVVAASERDKEKVGTHQNAMLGVEISSEKDGKTQFKEVVWVPFSAFVIETPQAKDVTLEDGRTLQLAFGRLRYPLPGFTLQLLDFHMIPNENRGPPKDYQSVIRVLPSMRGGRNVEAFTAMASLNDPLRAPFHWDDNKSYIANAAGKIMSGLDPYQLKFSQAGWDASGWEQTQKQADAGVVPRPYVKFTRLQVGNNPGIHIIALGGILMGIGIPWAFYVKPWLVQREKKKIQQQIKDGTYVKPVRTGAQIPVAQGSAS